MAFAVFGDSYVARLKRFAYHDKHRAQMYNYYGVPGMSTRRKFDDTFDRLLESRPRYVFLNVGGNNIDVYSQPGTIFNDIVSIVNQLYEAGVEKVFVASIAERGRFPAWTGMDHVSFNKVRRSVNVKLRKHFRDYFVDVGKKIKINKHYDDDQIHPNRLGLKLLADIVTRCFEKC